MARTDKNPTHMNSCTKSFGDRCLIKYMLAAQAEFKGSKFLSIGADCGRIGKRNMWVGLMGKPSNMVAIVPPMETHMSSLFLGILSFGRRNLFVGGTTFARHCEIRSSFRDRNPADNFGFVLPTLRPK